MKRKIFSKLLMGAFLIASVSSFVSCKDYDDDINNLQKQIDAAALKAELTTLQTNLAAQIAAAQSAAQAAQAAAEKAQATANNAATKDALEAVKTLATTAGTDAAKAIADAANAQNTADVAKSAAQAAQEAAAAAQNVANGASDKAATALADAAKALATAEAANATATAANAAAKAAQDAAGEAKTTAGEAKATADNALAAAGNATTQAADALKAAGEAKAAAEAAKYNDEAVKLLIAQAQSSADAAAQDAKDAAEAAAAAVLASASATEDAAAAKAAAAKIDEAIAEATKAINEAADAKIKAAVAAVEAKIPADQSAAVEALKGDLKTLAETQKGLATAEGLSAAVTALEGKLDGAADAAAAAAVAAAAGTINAAVAELYAAVTSVELVASYTGWDLNPDADSETYPLGFTASTSTNINLDFIFGKQQFTATFGDKETENLDDDAVEKISYKKGDDIRAKRALLIRVNPVNATFTKDQVKFINSKLETLDEIVEIGDPYRFKGMITRSSQESGLWVIPVKVKENIGFNKFNETTFYKGSAADWKYDKNTGDLQTWLYESKLYAVAINNTPDMDDAEGVSRYVASTYDVSAEYVHYQPAYVLNALFEWSLDDADYFGTTRNGGMSDNSIWYGNVIHNRWTTYANYSEPTSGVRSKDQTNAYSIVEACHEKAWNTFGASSYTAIQNTDQYKAGLIVPNPYEPNKPTEKTVKGSKVKDAIDDGNDYRYGSSYLTVANVGDPIKVYLPSALQKKVEYWYISFDFEHNAVESKPSEWEAWQSYQDGIEGIYKTVRGDKPIDLVVNKATAQGDVIGFRVWAVNYDGSLVDPDGKAFYIKLGEEPEAQTLTASASVLAVNAATGMASSFLTDEDKTNTPEKGFNVSYITKIDGNQFKSLNDWDSATTWNGGSTTFGTGFSGVTTVTGTGVQDGDIFNTSSVSIYWALLKSDKKTIATDWKDIAYIKAGIPGSQLINLRDGATLTLVTLYGTRKDVNNQERYKIDVKVTKQMPDDAFTKKNFFDGMITWKTDYGWDPATNVLTTYVKPYYDLMAYGLDYLKPHFIKGTGGAADQFYWRWQSAAPATMAAWINDAEWLNWDYSANTNLANAGVRMIDDYIASVKPEVNKALYKWVFEGMPTQLTGNGVPASKDYTALWTTGVANQDVADNGVMAAMPKAVREDAQFDSKLKYTYKNVSATNKWNNGTNAYDWTRGDLDRNANSFKTDFKDAMDLLTYYTSYTYLVYDRWAKNAIDVPHITGKGQLVDQNLYIDWLGTNGGTNLSTYAGNTDFAANLFRLALVDKSESAVGTAASQSFNPNTFDKFANLGAGSSNLVSFMKSNISDADKVLAENKQMIANICNGAGVDRDNAGDGAFGNANKFAFNENHYKFDDPNRKATDPVVTKMKIELEGAITTYLKVSTTATPTALTLQKIGGVQDPHENVPGNIKLSGFDVFGKKHVFNIPVVIIFNK